VVETLWAAIALVLVVEGLMPLLAPRRGATPSGG
jgi:uncharacterized protein YjeT (DUF2065 family)